MKYLRSIILMAAALTANVFISSCSNEENEFTETGIETNEKDVIGPHVGEDVKYEIVSDETLTTEEFIEAVFGKDGANGDEGKEELIRNFRKKQQALSDKLAAELGSNGLAMGYRSINYTYYSKDAYGNRILLSARVYWGTYWFFGTYDLDPDYIVLCPHYTICSNDECPTQTHTPEAMSICGDNLVIMPDYIGYGQTVDRLHPYINQKLCAQNSIDALEAGYKVFKDNADASMESDWKMYVVGASQGGGNALAIHKWLDQHLDFANNWNFDYSYCCAGPYDPGLTFEKYFEHVKHSLPCVFPLTIKAMKEAYPEILGKWKEEEFYSKDYVKNHKEEIDEMISSKKYTLTDINNKLFTWYSPSFSDGAVKILEIEITDLLSDEVQDKNSEMYKALMKCLKDQEVISGWTPTHKIKLYHSEEDDVVPFENAQAVKDAFGDKVEIFTSGYGTTGHVATCAKFLGSVLVNNW